MSGSEMLVFLRRSAFWQSYISLTPNKALYSNHAYLKCACGRYQIDLCENCQFLTRDGYEYASIFKYLRCVGGTRRIEVRKSIPTNRKISKKNHLKIR